MNRINISCRKKWDGVIDPEAGYEYALVYMISELRLIPVDQLPSVDLSECMEARIFGPDAELHLFREEDEMMAVAIRDLGEGELCDEKCGKKTDSVVHTYATIDRTHLIRKNCRKEIPGRSELIIREYIAYDGDGQAYTVRTRLAGLL